MKATLEKKALSEALSALTRVVERRQTIPILANVMLTPGADVLGLFVSDLGIEMKMTIVAETVSGEGTTVPAAMLSDIVSRLKDGAQVVLETIDANRIAVRSGRSRFVLPTLAISDFPDFAKGDFAAEFELPAETLSDLMTRPAPFISHEKTRYYLNGVHLRALQDTLRAEATDGAMGIQLDCALPSGAETIPPSVIVPEKTCGAIAKICEAHKKQPITVRVSRTVIGIEIDGVSLTSKLIDGTFPDLDRVMPRGNDKTLVADKAEIEAALARVSAVVSERGRVAKWSLTERGLTLSARGEGGAEATEEVEADYDSAPLDIGFNSAFARDVVGAVKGERIRVELADPGSPTLFLDPDEKSLTIVLMPARV